MEGLEPFCWGAISQYATYAPKFKFPCSLAGGRLLNRRNVFSKKMWLNIRADSDKENLQRLYLKIRLNLAIIHVKYERELSFCMDICREKQNLS